LQEPQEQEQKQQQQKKPQTKEEEKRHGAGDEYERTTRITGTGSTIDSNPSIKEQEEKEQQHQKEEQEKQQKENKQEQESSQSSPTEMMEEPSSATNNQHTSLPNTTTSDQEEQDDNKCYKEPHSPFRRPTSSNPPGNCPDGGQWGIVKYIGNKTGVLICLGCFLGGIFGLCMLACPQDEKDAYRVNGELYDAAGAYMGLTKKYKFIPTRT
jgi:hypothetical protein